MILPAEADDALAGLRSARNHLGDTIDDLNNLAAPAHVIRTFTEAHEAVSWCIDRIAPLTRHQRDADRAEAVEERHIECQTFPWAEEP